jgi:predicted TIM-barrel fold metal-dependent hydrolase
MIIDGHAHVTRAEYGSFELLLKEMDTHGIDRAVLFPGGMIDVRRMSNYIGTDTSVSNKSKIVNDLVEALFREHPERFYGFYCIDPRSASDGPAELRAAVGRGFRGLKLAPIVHKFGFFEEPVLDLVAVSGQLGVPVYSHVVYGVAATTEKFGLLAERFPKTIFILGHMGFGPADMEAIEIAQRNDNVFLESSGGSYMIIKAALERLGATKLIYGSEFPLHHPYIELEKVRLASSSNAFEQITSKTLLSLIC